VEDENSSNLLKRKGRVFAKIGVLVVILLVVAVALLFISPPYVLLSQGLDEKKIISYDPTVLLTAYQRYAYPKYSYTGGIGNNLWNLFNRDLTVIKVSVKVVNKLPYRPLKRIVHDLKYGNIDIFALLAYTKSRASSLLYSSVPVYITSSVFVKRRDFPFTYAGPYSLTGLRVGVVSGSRTGKVLMNILEGVNGVSVYEISDVMSLLRMIKRKRLDIGFYSALSLSYIVDAFYRDLDIVPASLDRYGHYLVFSKKIDSRIVNYINHLLIRYIRSGLVDRILERYNVPHESTFSLNTLYVGIVRSNDIDEIPSLPPFIVNLQNEGINVNLYYVWENEADKLLLHGSILGLWDVKAHGSSYFPIDGGIFSCSDNIPGICEYMKYVLYGDGYAGGR